MQANCGDAEGAKLQHAIGGGAVSKTERERSGEGPNMEMGICAYDAVGRC